MKKEATRISDRQMKSTQTRCDNIYKKLEENIEPLYKKRVDLIQDLQFFYMFREHEKIPKLSVKQLNTTRAGIMYKLAILDIEVEKITNEMLSNHSKKIEVFKAWQKQRQES